MRYKILRSENPDDLAEMVQGEINLGWRPLGGPFTAPFCRGFGYRAMPTQRDGYIEEPVYHEFLQVVTLNEPGDNI